VKAIKYIAIGIGAFFAGRYIFSLNRAKEKILVAVSGKRDKISLQGVMVELNYNIKNPTRAKMKVTAPLIKLSSNGSLLASSTMQQVEIPQAVKDQSGRIIIDAFKETGKITTKILIPWLSILKVSSQLYNRLKSGEKVSIEIETISQVFTPITDFPLDDKTTIEV